MDSVKINHVASITLNVPMISVSHLLTENPTLVKTQLNLVPTTKLSLTRTSPFSPKKNKKNGWVNVLIPKVAYLVLSMLNVTIIKDVPLILVKTKNVSIDQFTMNGAILNLKDKLSLSKLLPLLSDQKLEHKLTES